MYILINVDEYIYKCRRCNHENRVEPSQINQHTDSSTDKQAISLIYSCIVCGEAKSQLFIKEGV